MRRAVGWLVLAALAHATPALALDPNDWEADSTDARSYEQVRIRYREPLAALDYAKVFRALARDLETAPVWNHDDAIYQHLAASSGRLVQLFDGFQLPADVSGRAVTLDSFLTVRSTGAFQFPCPGGECFKPPDVVTYDELALIDSVKSEDFLQRVRTYSRLLTDFKRPAVRRTVGSIQLARDRWATFIDEARSQYPWEVLLNGWIIGSGTIERPPMRQLVLAHPTVAVEMTTEDIQELRAKETLAIEAIGLIAYRWRNASAPGAGLSWWGLSAIASIREDMRPGVGALLHYGRMVTLGVTWHDDDRDDAWFDRPPYVIASFDLFQLAKVKIPAYRSKLATLEALAASSSPSR